MTEYSSPIFVVGVARSGTTLLRLILDSHSRIAIPDESNFIVQFYKDRGTFGDLSTKSSRLALVQKILDEPFLARWDHRIEVDDVDLDECTTLAAAVDQVYGAYARHSGKDIWGDKTPMYISDLHIINKMFPTCRFIHLIRDGRDVALSLIQRRFGPSDFAGAIRFWKRNVECARKMLAMLPDDRYIEVKFEDFVSDPASHLRRITDFLEVDFEPNMLCLHQELANVKVGELVNSYHSNLLTPISTSQTNKWMKRLGRADQAIAHEEAGIILHELGYPEGATRHALKVVRKAYHRLRQSYLWRVSGKKEANPSKRNRDCESSRSTVLIQSEHEATARSDNCGAAHSQ